MDQTPPILIELYLSRNYGASFNDLTTWVAVKQALISEFGSDQTLINQKQAFMAIQIRSGKTAPAFAERFYREA